ncbi:TetR family transcriptional regulator [Volucribacter psittacicida]|uniref:TetR family transcriptional regulator n=1 Tax=Volucribacter psittacicida TaxID=203482 RepID=A0A4R1FYC0_9PAST|nr:TetR family transcriptional regulator C-terminal domain-containing protein [Volucribacter psittacicida]TCJ98769.1 TetR family transcriptional regulator [Volucribacter psittacicida]
MEKRGRPIKKRTENNDTKTLLIRTGIAWLTETGYLNADINGILQQANVPKGSFYYHFKNKQDFGLAVIQGYGEYFAKKLDRFLLAENIPPLQRLFNFTQDCRQGMQKYAFKRGCLIGNVAQESALLPTDYHILLQQILQQWQNKIAQCLHLAQQAEQISLTLDCQALATFFWTGWEGAVMRAKLSQSALPLDNFIYYFKQLLGDNDVQCHLN